MYQRIRPITWDLLQAKLPRPLFDASSTPDATRMRLLALQIAEVAPEGATITTPARPDGREGELFWPLQVLRPDLRVQPLK